MKNKLFILVLLFCNTTLPHTWTNPVEGKVSFSYVYAPGMSCSETQLAKYCPKFIASTGELVTCTHGIETIQDCVHAATFAEVNLKSNRETLFSLARLGAVATLYPCYLYLWNKLRAPYCTALTRVAVPTASTYLLWKPVNFAFTYGINKRFGIQVQKISDNATHSVLCHHINPFKINVGQETDIHIYKSKIDELVAKQLALGHTATSSEPMAEPVAPEQKVILYGVSRGSATVFNYFALHDSDKIAAVICEGIFDKLDNILKYCDLFSTIKINLLKYSRLTNFKPDGICPLACLDKINKDKPLAIITSLVDEVVPTQCTQNLYKRLRELGHMKVHILILKTSKHSVYPTGSEKENYQAFIHAFYKHYNLPYIEQFAAVGQKPFEQSRPELA